MKESPSRNEKLMEFQQGVRILTDIEKELWTVGSNQVTTVNWMLRTNKFRNIFSDFFKNFVSKLFKPTQIHVSHSSTEKVFIAGKDIKKLLPGKSQGGNYDYSYPVIKPLSKISVVNGFNLFAGESLSDDTSFKYRFHKLTTDKAQTASGAYFLNDVIFEAAFTDKPCKKFHIIHALMIVGQLAETRQIEEFKYEIWLPLLRSKKCKDNNMEYFLKVEYNHTSKKIQVDVWGLDDANQCIGTSPESGFILEKAKNKKKA
jgi:hypothetical protein